MGAIFTLSSSCVFKVKKITVSESISRRFFNDRNFTFVTPWSLQDSSKSCSPSTIENLGWIHSCCSLNCRRGGRWKCDYLWLFLNLLVFSVVSGMPVKFSLPKSARDRRVPWCSLTQVCPNADVNGVGFIRMGLTCFNSRRLGGTPFHHEG
jgi:hypothetical protein